MRLLRFTFLLYAFWALERTDSASQNVDEPLFLTPLIYADKTDTARRLARVKPLVENIDSYSGFFTVNKTTKSHMFFWFFPTTNTTNSGTSPLVIWLGSGPGTSSLLGLFLAVGPLEVIPSNGTSTSLKKRAPAWTDDHNMLFVDQPVDAGFSFTDGNGYLNTTEEAAEQLHDALSQFLLVFTEFRERDLYIAGESYAGKYITALGRKIHKANQQPPVSVCHMKLKGLIVGNGFMEPESMVEFDLLLSGVGLIYQYERESLRRIQDATKFFIRTGRWSTAYLSYGQLLRDVQTLINSTNFYDTRRVDEYFDSSSYTEFVSQDWVRQRIHVGSTKFASTSTTVARRFELDFLQSARSWVEELLEIYPVLFYNGVFDILCAPMFMDNFLNQLNWSGAMKYRMATKTALRVDDGRLLGYFKYGHNLNYVTVRNAGHSATLDEPENTRKLVTAFIRNSTFLANIKNFNATLS